MGIALLWIESLACALLLAALAAAHRARSQRPWVRGLLPVAAIGPPLTCYVAMAALSVWAYVSLGVLAWAPPAAIGLLVCYAAGLVWMRLRASRAREGRSSPAEWSRGRLAAALGIVAGMHLMTFWHLDLGRRQQLNVLRADAGAMATALAPPRPPDEQNAALDYQQAFDHLVGKEGRFEGWRDEWTRLLAGDANAPDPRDPNIAAFLERHQTTLRLLRRGAAKPGCYFEHDYYAPSIAMTVPEIMHSRWSGQLLALSARLRAASADAPGAIEDFRAAFRLAEHSGSGPFLLSMLVASSIDATACSALQACVSSGQLTARQLAGLELPDTVSYQRQCARALRMEEAFCLATYAAVASGQVRLGDLLDSCAPDSPLLPLYRVLLLEEDLRADRRLSEIQNRLTALPYHESRSEWKSVHQGLDRQLNGILVRALFPALWRMPGMAAEADARRRVLQVVLAACRFRARHEAFPQRPEDLVPDFLIAAPADPFDGKPLRWKRTDRELVVYSIGEDGKDDGGGDYDRKGRTGDIAFHLPG